ncbi:hypothetical protein C8Q74DRAFT_1056441 [Fomes fomentarius]|nr:hypothetical protein C8Q74DRAFT_1056441 [Fomes fomentarius]
MAVPIVLLRRHRAATLGKALKNAPPPPRRTTSSKGIPIANPTVQPSLFSVRDSASPSASTSLSSSSSTVTSGDNFNGALQCAKAFGIATALVGVGAFVSVWGVRRYMGVETTQEFADRMRLAVLTRLPVLSSRIHRPPEPEDGDALLPPPQAILSESSATPSTSAQPTSDEWSWAAAEQRLRVAFEKHGFTGWVAAAMQELEAEGRVERAKRGHA